MSGMTINITLNDDICWQIFIYASKQAEMNAS